EPLRALRASREYFFLVRPTRSRLAGMPCAQVEELAARAWAVRREGWIRLLAVCEVRLRDRVLFRVAPQFFRGEAIGFRRVQAEHLCAQRRCHRRIAVLFLQLLRDLKRAERLNLILRRSVPNRIRAPEDVVLADVLEQLSQRMGG